MRPETTKLGKKTQNKGHLAVQAFKVIQGHRFRTNRKLIYNFLLVINTNLPSILHRFRNTACQMPTGAYAH